ncbi:MAG TPA: dihydrolipoamide acetyltransferase family protein [Solirubrobacteraceae bacterium]|jgi:pyruvate dehydrogenase E2 component (dihydrolipoamide acetyltransferase)|nr:dihydrolipoamide acetyltransferase family protein [Solirubrobacteraceae bacterium]
MSDTPTGAASRREIAMPRLSDSMQEGTILRWLIGEGERVEHGAELVEIETDKAGMTYESDLEGVLQILVPEGETVAVGMPIARVGERVAGASGGPRPEHAAVAVVGAAADAEIAADAESAVAPGSELPATPLARRVARVHGVSLKGLSGSGPRGRILQADVLRAAGVAEPARAPAPERPASAPVGPEPVATGKGGATRVEPTRTQRLIARRMAEAKATIPDFQVQAEVAMDAAIAFRAELKGILELQAPSLNDLIVKASALALRGHPRANGSYLDGGFELHERVNVGVAVAAEEALVVPVVPDADRKALAQIARETRRLAERVRLGEVTPPELSGATFTVSNLGMYGMSAIVPVINPPQAAILGVGAIREVLARVGGEIVERRLMTLTLSCDHRILYGADASLFLAEVKGMLEAPLQLAL